MKNKIVLTTVSFSMFFSACSPSSNNPVANKKPADNLAIRQVNQLLQSESPNIPLAEMLVGLLKEQDPVGVQAYRSSFAEGSEYLLSRSWDQEWNAAKRQLIIGNSAAANNHELLNAALNFNLNDLSKHTSFSRITDSKLVGAVRSAAMESLLKTYERQLQEDSTFLAAEVLRDIRDKSPDILEKIDLTKNSRNQAYQIEQIVIYLKRADHILWKYGFSESDQDKLVLYTAIAGGIAIHLKDHPTVQSLIAKAKKAKDLVDRANRVLVLGKALQQHGKELKEDAVTIGESSRKIFNQAKGMMDALDSSVLKLSEDGRRKAKLLLDETVNGRLSQTITSKEEEELKNSGFFQKRRELDRDVKAFVSSADRAAKSLENIVGITEQIADTMGLELSSGVKNALETARKVTQGVQLVNTISNAFQSGGFVGAMSAFAGGPGLMAFNSFAGIGGGSNASIISDLAEIKQSLVEIKEMQKEILQNQRTTMIMIKDLALILEDFHWEQMRALTDLREDVFALNEAIREVDGKDFNSCQAILNYAFFTKNVAVSKSILKESNIDSLKELVKDSISHKKGLNAFIRNTSSENFKTCQKELGNVFGNWELRKFHRATWYEGNPNNVLEVVRSGAEISKKLYLPLLNSLNVPTAENSVDQYVLHLPSRDVVTVMDRKQIYLRYAVGYDYYSRLAELTATERLEQYVAALIVLYPLLAIDESVWMGDIQDIVSEGAKNSTQERMRHVLLQALERVKVAIAQEAILAGEPLLPSLSAKWHSIMAETEDCRDQKQFCSVRSNNLLMENLLTYVVVQRLGVLRVPGYETELGERYKGYLNNRSSYAELLGVSTDRLEVGEKGKVFLVLSKNGQLKVALPSVDRVVQGRIQYTEAMGTMLKLENRLVEELLKISPTVYTKEVRENVLMSLFL